MKEKILDKKEIREFLAKNHIVVENFQKISDGISNYNILINDKYVLKIPYDKKFLFFNESKIKFQEKLYEAKLAPLFIDYDAKEGLYLSKFIPDLTKIDPRTINLYQVNELVDKLLLINKMKIDELEVLDYSKLLDYFRLLVEPKERIYSQAIENSLLFLNPQQVSHFDLVDNNILFDKNNNVVFLDFEFSCQAPMFFDLTSLLSENNFPSNLKESIVEMYFKDDVKSKEYYLKHYDEYCAIFDLLWYHWALARSNTKDQFKSRLYLQIAATKKRSLAKFIKLTY